jgi:protein-disulfide isomerase
MKRFVAPGLGAAFLALGLALGLTASVTASAQPLDDEQKAVFGAFIREYLVQNPDVLIEAQQALEARQQADQQAQASRAIAQVGDDLFSNPLDGVVGNPEGDVTIVEFFDYNCGFCKRAHADMEAILAADDNVRFVLKEFPILGPDSLAAHRVSMALRKAAPDQYEAFHTALMSSADRATEASALQVAAELGVDGAALSAAMADPQIDEQIGQSYQLANTLGITGTPSYVVGDEAVFGAMGAEVLFEKVENMRRCDKPTC